MAKRCKHGRAHLVTLSGQRFEMFRWPLTRKAFSKNVLLTASCAYCGEQLSLGESAGRRSGANALARPTASMLAEAELHERAEIQKMRHANDLGRLAEKMERSGHLDSTISHVTGLTGVEVITGPEPETGVEVEILTSHEINADCHSLGCIEDGAAHDPDEDDELAVRVRSDDPAPVESEIGGEA